MQFPQIQFAVLLARVATAERAVSQLPLNGDSDAARTPVGGIGGGDLDEYIEKSMNHYHVPGLSIGIVHGEDINTAAYGFARLPDVPASPDTLYYVASLSKSITAATLLYTLEKISNSSSPLVLDTSTRVADIIREDFVLPDEYATAHANLLDLLCHRTGMTGDDMAYGGTNATVKDTVRLMRHLPMLAELRAEFQYLNLGYITLQHVIETLTGESISKAYKEAVWGPLGMTATTVLLADALGLPETLSYGYSWDDSKNRSARQPWMDTPIVGAAGIISSVDDFTKYLRAMMHQTLPVSRGMQQKLTSPLIVLGDGLRVEPFTTAAYAMGWVVGSYRGNRVTLHTGGVPGHTSIVAFMPDLDWGTVMFSNADTGINAIYVILQRLLDDLLDVPEEDRLDLVSKLDVAFEKKTESWMNSRELLYPDVADPPLLLPLPLEEFAGTYHNPGFRDIAFAVRDRPNGVPMSNSTQKVLHAVWRRVWNVTVDLEHVSGEHFLARVDSEVPSMGLRVAVPAKFAIGPSGKVLKLGIAIEPALASKRQIVWFDRM